MNLAVRFGIACPLFALCACGSPEQRPFNEQFNSTAAELENRARTIEAEADNIVDAQSAELDEQARALDAASNRGENIQQNQQ